MEGLVDGHVETRWVTERIAPVEVMLERLRMRTSNTFGKSDEDRERILGDLRDVEPLLRATSTAIVDGTQPIEPVADAVEAFA